MNSLSCGWFLRPTIRGRIAVAMVISLILIQAQAFAQIWLFAEPVVRLTGARWLAETTADVARETFALPASERDELLRQRAKGSILHLTWSAERPWGSPDVNGDPIAARLAATLRRLLGADARNIEVFSSKLIRNFPRPSIRVEVAPDAVARQLGAGPILPADSEVLIPASLRVAVQGADGSWVGIAPVGLHDDGFRPSLPTSALAVGGLIIIVVSTLAARRIIAPLNRLVKTAEQIGTAREFVSVPEQGLGEFAAVARAFEDMQRKLLRFVDDRTQMLAAISHDLRSSLTRLRLAAEDCRGEDERAALNGEIDYMQAMLEMTLAFASGEARMAPTQNIDIAALLISLVDEAADSGKDCEYSGPDHVETMGHPVSLKRAFWNLIDNALKYGDTARVALVAGDESIVIRIEDRGPGIPRNRWEEAFSPFQRLDPARCGNIPGAGLGLTIARDVVQSHGGTIELTDRAAGGLVVSIILPRKQCERANVGKEAVRA